MPFRALQACGAAAALAACAPAQGASVPQGWQGVWAKDGRCNEAADLLTIRGDAVRWGRSPFEPVHFEPQDPGPSIHFTEDGVVSNFEAGPAPNTLLYHPQGYDMPGTELYMKCTARHHIAR